MTIEKHFSSLKKRCQCFLVLWKSFAWNPKVKWSQNSSTDSEIDTTTPIDVNF